jgi:hypothetical protein
MGLYEQAISDAAKITSDLTGFGVAMVLVAPTLETVSFTGLTTEIGLGVDTDGNMVVSKKATASFSEKFLTDANYPVRNIGLEVNISGHKLNVKNSTGVVKNYIIQQCFADETIGLLTCILEDYHA